MTFHYSLTVCKLIVTIRTKYLANNLKIPIQEVKSKNNPLKHKILSNYALLAEKNKSKTEKALSSFMELASSEVVEQ